MQCTNNLSHCGQKKKIVSLWKWTNHKSITEVCEEDNKYSTLAL